MNLLSIPLTFILLIGVTNNSTAQQGKTRVFKGSEFLAEFNDEGLSRFSSTEDKFNTNIVAKDEVWGNVNLNTG